MLISPHGVNILGNSSESPSVINSAATLGDLSGKRGVSDMFVYSPLNAHWTWTRASDNCPEDLIEALNAYGAPKPVYRIKNNTCEWGWVSIFENGVLKYENRIKTAPTNSVSLSFTFYRPEASNILFTATAVRADAFDLTKSARFLDELLPLTCSDSSFDVSFYAITNTADGFSVFDRNGNEFASLDNKGWLMRNSPVIRYNGKTASQLLNKCVLETIAVKSELAFKADRPSGFSPDNAGNLASFDNKGNLADSGVRPDNFIFRYGLQFVNNDFGFEFGDESSLDEFTFTTSSGLHYSRPRINIGHSGGGIMTSDETDSYSRYVYTLSGVWKPYRIDGVPPLPDEVAIVSDIPDIPDISLTNVTGGITMNNCDLVFSNQYGGSVTLRVPSNHYDTWPDEDSPIPYPPPAFTNHVKLLLPVSWPYDSEDNDWQGMPSLRHVDELRWDKLGIYGENKRYNYVDLFQYANTDPLDEFIYWGQSHGNIMSFDSETLGISIGFKDIYYNDWRSELDDFNYYNNNAYTFGGTGPYAMAIGVNSVALGIGSIAHGAFTTLSTNAESSVAIGISLTVTNSNTIVISAAEPWNEDIIASHGDKTVNFHTGGGITNVWFDDENLVSYINSHGGVEPSVVAGISESLVAQTNITDFADVNTNSIVGKVNKLGTLVDENTYFKIDRGFLKLFSGNTEVWHEEDVVKTIDGYDMSYSNITVTAEASTNSLYSADKCLTFAVCSNGVDCIKVAPPVKSGGKPKTRDWVITVLTQPGSSVALDLSLFKPAHVYATEEQTEPLAAGVPTILTFTEITTDMFFMSRQELVDVTPAD